MNIESLKTSLMTLSTPSGLAEQGSGQQAAVKGQSVQNGSEQVPADVVTVSRRQSAADKEEQKKQQQSQTAEPKSTEIYKYKAVFAVDDEKNVVIRFVDKKGEVVRQVPPEEYLDMIGKFRESTDHLFSAKA